MDAVLISFFCSIRPTLFSFFPILLQPTHMADFSHVQSIQTVVGGDGADGGNKAVLQLRVAGSSELLTITCPSLAVAENMADLVDGYCRLVNSSSTSIWNRKGKKKAHNLPAGSFC